MQLANGAHFLNINYLPLLFAAAGVTAVFAIDKVPFNGMYAITIIK